MKKNIEKQVNYCNYLYNEYIKEITLDALKKSHRNWRVKQAKELKEKMRGEKCKDELL